MFVIYCATNRFNSKRYVGQTRRALRERWAGHLSEARSSTTRFHHALRKYGREAFTLEPIDYAESVEDANDAETWWIAHFCSDDPRFGYNLDAGGRARLTHPSTREKLSEAQRRRFSQPGAKERLSASLRGRQLSSEHRQNLTAARVGHQWTKGGVRVRTEAHNQRIATARTGQKHAHKYRVAQIDADGNIVAVYPSLSEAARVVGACGANTIGRCVKGLQPMAGGFRWKLVDAP